MAKETLIRHKSGVFETFGSEKYQVEVKDPDGKTKTVTRSRQDDLADLDPSTYDVVDPDQLAAEDRLAAVDGALEQMKAERSKLAKGAKR
jgi:hypothetical protein